ncbi:L-ascorbic acid binding protein [Coniochaeta hoffmannii]|uniref:L-ascorbic acid binding protein n=1 Tax=Coniochaeta hoffmannii TaxID=91930 RepID=A0AA38VDZ3_9PEZI|nr:L-ascorbic acid binding protein [Coniochaeta hoffmannii]
MPKAKPPKAAKGKDSKTTNLTAPAPPNWPVFRPPLPVIDLLLETLVESKVVVLRNFWPQKLCHDYVAFLKTLPLTTTPGKPKRGEAVRVNDRFQIHDPAFASRLWLETGLKEALLDENVASSWGGEVVGLSPNIRVYRYSKGQYFDCHYDESNNLNITIEESQHVSAKTTWTLLLYLTSAADGCKGGETVFYPHDRPSAKEEIAVPPETGMLLLHKHGDDCMLHEGREVKSGEKWVLRTDLCVRR